MHLYFWNLNHQHNDHTAAILSYIKQYDLQKLNQADEL